MRKVRVTCAIFHGIPLKSVAYLVYITLDYNLSLLFRVKDFVSYFLQTLRAKQLQNCLSYLIILQNVKRMAKFVVQKNFEHC